MGKKSRGGLAGPKEIEILINNPSLAQHLRHYWVMYTEIADKWKKWSETNDFENTSVFKIIDHVAVNISHTNKDTKVKRLAKDNNFEYQLVTELFAKVCYESEIEPDVDFPEALDAYFITEN